MASAATERALLDQYCVTCHNDRAKTANLSLAQLDLATVGDHPELWEKVVRKLRAGVMPLSPTLLEAYTTAAMRVARMAVGFWKTPSESTYLAPGDTSQNRHIE